MVNLGDSAFAPRVENVELLRPEGPQAWLRCDRERIRAAALIAEVVARYPIHELTVAEPEIESHVRGIYEHGLRH